MSFHGSLTGYIQITVNHSKLIYFKPTNTHKKQNNNKLKNGFLS